ncbi:MAG: 2-isopropylmalate synthase [bacterium]|nr:2-isopropylmalate synthase [bacterium]
MGKNIIIFDTTLRDGEQSPGISLNIQDKLEIAMQLARLGVDVIEAGFPITSEGDFKAVKTIAEEVEGPVICGLSRAVRKDIERAGDALRNCKKPRIHTFINSSDVQIKHQLKKTRKEVLQMTEEAVKLAKSICNDIEFSAMDATRADINFIYELVGVAIENGATTINIPDTVGYSMPWEFGEFIASIIKNVKRSREVVWSVHCHNDLGLSVANSICAVKNGVTQVECTINGIGERAGNAAMEELVMIMDTRKDILNVSTKIKTAEIMKTSQLISRLTGYQVQPNKAIVGMNAFAHTSGIHQDGVLKERTTFEIMNPQKIGLKESKLILGKTSGRHAFSKHLGELGYFLNEESLERAFVRFKDLADKKVEITENDLEAIAQDEKRISQKETFVFESIETSSGTGKIPQASIKLKKDDKIISAKADGDGQVDAVCNAISRATGIKTKLLVYNVSSITSGLDSQGEVTIHLEIGGKRIIGRGVSTDIIEASAKAYLNAINKSIQLKEK